MAFEDDFRALTCFTPLPWQARLFERHFGRGDVPAALDLPTGLGKTAVMAIWLCARAAGAALPRRLVYVVDRRAVVDQATTEAEKLRKNLDCAAAHLKPGLGLADRSLPISTLRGQHVDNRDWLADPARPTIIVGTVDMIGSRLLFEGYGVSRRMRPYHAGLLGADALIVIDEAHLVPPFERLLDAITADATAYGPRDGDDRAVVPPLKVLPLSATGRERQAGVFRLQGRDHGQAAENELVSRRLNARKAVTVATPDGGKLEDALAAAAWRLGDEGRRPVRCLIYCDRRETAEKTKQRIEAYAAGGKRKGVAPAAIETELYTGARRFFEREAAADRVAALGFIAGKRGERVEPDKTAFLVATSAAEVGVDLDADHMVCDLVEWERMVQRLGRVNRRGMEAAGAHVVIVDASDTEKDAARKARLEAARALLDRLVGEYQANGCPASLRDLHDAAGADAIAAASTPEPPRPGLTRALVDAWSMTSLDTHTGRPEIAPWLRGWIDEEPRTAVLWREHLPGWTGDSGEPFRGPTDASSGEAADFFDAAPPHMSEKLETETHAVAHWLFARAERCIARAKTRTRQTPAEDRSLGTGEIVAFVLSASHEVKGHYRLSDFDGDSKSQQRVRRVLAGATLVLDARFAGLSGDGLLDANADKPPPTADDPEKWCWEQRSDDGPANPLVEFRVRMAERDDDSDGDNDDDAAKTDWHKRFVHALTRDREGNAVRQLIVEKWRGASTREEERSVARPQCLKKHQDWTGAEAERLACALGLTGDAKAALVLAARLHDEGKCARRWQRAFGAARDARRYGLPLPLAKTSGPVDVKLLDGYRHEFGSLPHVEADPTFKALPADWRQLVLHLVAAHHGQARPVIETRSCDDAPPSALAARARDVALRFATLQKRWGPWGLAWWEALLRAADMEASRRNDAQPQLAQRAEEA